MIVIVNLERLSGDGYKMNANSPLVTPPSYIKYAQLRYTPFTSAQAIQGTFVTGAYSTVEFDVTGANLTRYLKLYTSTDGTTYNEVKSWGGTDGIRQKEYLVYSALLTQEGTANPVVTVLTNELGFTITWEREVAGSYFCAVAIDSFPLTKTFAMIQQTSITTSDGIQVSIQIDDTQQAEIRTSDFDSTLVDGALLRTSVEIRIYP